jgi:hypothetical protein
VRVKVNLTHGNQMNAADSVVVGVRPSPHTITGRRSAGDQRAVFEWIALNTAALVEYWEGRVDTIQLGQMLTRLSRPAS